MAEMKQLMVGVLLVACVVIVCGVEQGRPQRDPCTNGMGALELFMHYVGCGPLSPWDTVDEQMTALRTNVTVHNLNNAITKYCSTAFPALRQCFIGNIQNCSSDQRDMLTTVAQQSGWLCQPNTSSVHPVVTHLLSQLTDADLVGAEQCYYDSNVEEIHHRCNNEALAAMGYTMDNVSQIQQLGMEQLAGKINTYFPTALRCIVEGIRDNPGGCSQWRGLALISFSHYLLPAFLSLTNTFSNDDIDHMFGWKQSSAFQTTD